ncbi:zinc ribbon domain-containing protein [Enterococcus avium]|uniref:Zinc ribbon domain-containing protein n=1 Tax=Enterococcus avium TaxID=33945 RepID=A0A437UN62_ENTAV|nr:MULTISPECIES: zinc ribbon domain-containing protein [Enterococcus]MDT2423777.1 zinc ribbon domain-containing protein [Enterococcus avium]MDT2436776.1 zinc ribbon domain-containing protein [Enterococcus avium]MDT2465940.1 zinc ribbon domain-containing protein [Enterococcus avium]MDT2505375.1 zinc ribbon domain-containing protein [Enterococcus avium]MDT2525350.1 zinc ribbon domain-containing protein [Enterococcus raffinosus]
MKTKNGKVNNKILVAVLVAVVGIIAFVVFGNSSSDIEEASKPIVDQILQEQYDLDRSCDDITITNDNGDDTYEAKATLDNGSAININIEYYPKKDRIYVQIPYSEVLLLN